ncbi:MAG: hypothetical protein HYY06_07575 [Deltaproteobacteria bacterium]|nr:hypothetical protein [Deltaproteobacteria bacterium]
MARPIAILMLVLSSACDGGSEDAADSQGGDDLDDPGGEAADDADQGSDPAGGGGGVCPTADLGTLESCCTEGAAHCMPAGSYPAAIESSAAPCDAGGVCIPDDIITTGAGYRAPDCESNLGAGACVSVCIPEVGQYADMLEQSTCASDQRCAPCVNPLTGEDVGICGAVLECDGPAGGDPGTDPGGGDEPEPPTCDDPPTEPVIDAAIFPPCCEGAHCVPADQVPEDQRGRLSECDEGAGACVPDVFIETLGVFTLPTCASIAGIEGRCMSTCLPDIGEQAEMLPEDTCAATERCVPCCDPFTGEDTGACSQSCDTGPAEACGEPAFETCCDDDSGHCIPTEMLPEEAKEGLRPCGESDGGGDDWGGGGGGDDWGGAGGEEAASYCVPDVMQDPDFAGAACQGNALMGEYAGVCLPLCLNIQMSFMLDTADCPDGYTCAPCTNPLTGEPTGAPGCA